MGPVAYWALTALFLVAVPPSLHLLLFVLQGLPWSISGFVLAALGAVAAAALIAFTRILQAAYIFFHELAHAAAVLLSSGTIHHIRFGIDLGWVQSDKSSFFIRLAPYFLPLFPLAVLALYYPAALLLRHQAPAALPLATAGLSFLFTLAWCAQWAYNVKLFALESSDLDRDRILLSVIAVTAAFLASTAGLFYLAYAPLRVLALLDVG
ncbi:MAG: hypothetical protein J0L75_17410 [Spirochaetes bacterium]|nr:hypothetical protein [Spirochaetota bacterium]